MSCTVFKILFYKHDSDLDISWPKCFWGLPMFQLRATCTTKVTSLDLPPFTSHTNHLSSNLYPLWAYRPQWCSVQKSQSAFKCQEKGDLENIGSSLLNPTHRAELQALLSSSSPSLCTLLSGGSVLFGESLTMSGPVPAPSASFHSTFLCVS